MLVTTPNILLQLRKEFIFVFLHFEISRLLHIAYTEMFNARSFKKIQED